MTEEEKPDQEDPLLCTWQVNAPSRLQASCRSTKNSNAETEESIRFASYASLQRPYGIAFGPDDNLYVACYLRSCVFRFHGKTGTFLDRFVRARSGSLKHPTYLKFGPAQRLEP